MVSFMLGFVIGFILSLACSIIYHHRRTASEDRAGESGTDTATERFDTAGRAATERARTAIEEANKAGASVQDIIDIVRRNTVRDAGGTE